jgi:Trypsin
VVSVGADSFEVEPDPSQPCAGDSGGPALDAGGFVVGVTSHGDGNCELHATYARVDGSGGDFIGATLTSLADGSAPAGAPCLFPERCAGGPAACVVAPDDPRVSYCSESCLTGADCPSGMACTESNAGLYCRYPLPTPGALGGACGEDADCVEGECTATGICAVRCVSGVTACKDGFSCDHIGGIDFFCVPKPVSPVNASGGACAFASIGPSAWEPLACLAALLGVTAIRRFTSIRSERRSSLPHHVRITEQGRS